jgi:hypothetical protein
MEVKEAIADVDLAANSCICGESWQIDRFREKIPAMGINVRYRLQTIHARRAMYWHILLKGATPVFDDSPVDFLHCTAGGLLDLPRPQHELANFVEGDLSQFTDKDKLAVTMPLDTPETRPLDSFQYRKGEVWVVKPVGESAASGSAVRCVYSAESDRAAREEIARNPAWRGIATKYVADPLLYHGKKFHVRGYIAVRSWAQPVFLPFGAAYLAGTEYADGDWGNHSMHITHYSDSFARVVFPEDFEGAEIYAKLWRDLMGKICKQLPAVQATGKFGYEILAPDVLFQRDPPRCVLLEINRMTSRLIDTPGKSTWDQTVVGWEYAHCVEPILSRFSRRFYLFSGKPDPQQKYLERSLCDAGLHPYPDCEYVKNGQLIPVDKPLHLTPFYLHMTSLLAEGKTGYDHNTYSATGSIQNVLDLNSCPISDKGWLHKTIDPRWIAKTVYLEQFKYNCGAHICRPIGAAFCAGYGIMYIASAADEAAARKYYADLQTKRRRPFKVIVSEYLSPMKLWRGRKCHLRLYLCVSASTAFREHARFSRFGKMFPAAKEFVAKNYGDMSIHDTHAASYPQDVFFPEDFDGDLAKVNAEISDLEKCLGDLTQTLRVFPQFAYGYCMYGVDLMIMEDHTLKLIEINDRTGFECQIENPDFYRKLAEFEFEHGIRAGL